MQSTSHSEIDGSIVIGKRVIKNTAILLVGRILSIVFGIIYVAFLARYIKAEGMGKIATATSLIGLLIILVNFGLSQLITRDVAVDRGKTESYTSNSLLLRGLLSFIFAAVVVLITYILKYPVDTVKIIYIYGFAYVFDNLSDVIFSIFIAYEKMEYTAVLNVGRDIFNILFSMLGIFLKADLVFLVFISALASFLKWILSMIVLRWRFMKPKLKFDIYICKQLLINSLPFIALLVVQVFNQRIDTILLSIYRTEEEVGWFSSAGMMLSYLLLIPAMFLQSIFPVFSRLNILSKDELTRTYQASFRYLLLLGIPMCIGTIIVSEPVINIVYGPGFENAVNVLRILAIQLFWIFGYANGALLTATGGQIYLAKIEVAVAALNLPLAIILIPRVGVIGASLASILPLIVFFMPVTIVCHRRVGLSLPLKLTTKTLIASILMGTIVVISLQLHSVLFWVTFAISPLIYTFFLVLLRAVDRHDLDIILTIFKKQRKTEFETLIGN